VRAVRAVRTEILLSAEILLRAVRAVRAEMLLSAEILLRAEILLKGGIAVRVVVGKISLRIKRS
jgi:hypothetical protein